MKYTSTKVELINWSETDLPLLQELIGTPEMARYVGGPESPEQVLQRHRRYVAIVEANSPKARTYKLVLNAGEEVGWVGYWETTWQGEPIYEIGWSVIPAFQGRGIATEGTAAAVRKAASENHH